MRSALLLGIACATALPLIALAQGVPIIDGTRVSNLISRLAEQAQDALKQEEKLGQQTRLNEIEDEQLAAYERFLADTTGTTDLSGFEDGSGSFPPADEVYPLDETSPESQRLFGEGETVESMIIATAHRYESHPGVVKVGLTATTWRILFQSLVKQESAFNNAAISPVGALGFCQLMPGTAADLGVDPSDPLQNLDGGARYLATQLNAFGRIDFALAAYNAGENAVIRHGRRIPPYTETRRYVPAVLADYAQRRRSPPQSPT